MQLWAVTMVKDEADIIGHTLDHLDSEGVDGIIVADNNSTDATREIIAGLDLDCELVCHDDPEVAYYQATKMTRLAHEAFAFGADWVIPFDADEIWYATTGPLRDTFARADADAGALLATLHNHFPVDDDDENESNPILRIRYRDAQPATLPKVAIPFNPLVALLQGNHDADGVAKIPADLCIAHYPWRGYERFRRKIENGYAAYLATDLPDDMGAHWRAYGEALERAGDAGLRASYEALIYGCDRLEHAPAPWKRHHRTPNPHSV